jgi:hypothetical protein
LPHSFLPQQFASLPDEAMPSEVKTHQDFAFGLHCPLPETVRLIEVHRQRLLDKHMLFGVERSQRYFGMKLDWNAHGDDVDFCFVQECTNVGVSIANTKLIRDNSKPRRILIGQSDDLCAGQPG